MCIKLFKIQMPTLKLKLIQTTTIWFILHVAFAMKHPEMLKHQTIAYIIMLTLMHSHTIILTSGLQYKILMVICDQVL